MANVLEDELVICKNYFKKISETIEYILIKIIRINLINNFILINVFFYLII